MVAQQGLLPGVPVGNLLAQPPVVLVASKTIYFRGCNWRLKCHLKSSCTSRGDLSNNWHLSLAKHGLSPDCSPAPCRQDCFATSSLIPAFIPRGQALQQGRSSSYSRSAFLPGQSPCAILVLVCAGSIKQWLLLTLLLSSAPFWRERLLMPR